MPKYITRIELLNAEDRDYELLDLEFKKELFVSTGKKKHNANAGVTRLKEYYKEGNITLQIVTSTVYNAAKKIGKKFSFTVIRDKGYFPMPDRAA